mmetsp:Transcript_122559/g.183286  ORF Transcript_122559/g.183286 Transcript_122559/m.183286 type:complete len:235 (-) Transcript_122559:317-1021(-)
MLAWTLLLLLLLLLQNPLLLLFLLLLLFHHLYQGEEHQNLQLLYLEKFQHLQHNQIIILVRMIILWSLEVIMKKPLLVLQKWVLTENKLLSLWKQVLITLTELLNILWILYSYNVLTLNFKHNKHNKHNLKLLQLQHLVDNHKQHQQQHLQAQLLFQMQLLAIYLNKQLHKLLNDQAVEILLLSNYVNYQILMLSDNLFNNNHNFCNMFYKISHKQILNCIKLSYKIKKNLFVY